MAYLILEYNPISKSFLAPKCVIKVRNPQLQQIGVTAPGFLITSLVPEGTFATAPIPDGIPKVALPLQRTAEEGTFSHPATTKEEEEDLV